MRLALLYHQFLTRGGLEGYLRELLTQLREAGHQVDLIGSKVDEAFRSAAHRVHILPPSKLGKTRWLQQFSQQSAALLPKLSGEVDAVLGFGRTWKQDIHRAGGGCHAVYSRQLRWHKRLGRKNRLELDLEKKLYQGGQTQRFVVNAPAVGHEIQENYGLAADRITVIPTGVDTDYFCPAATGKNRQAMQQELTQAAPTGPVLLFVSLDHRRKGLEPLLAALAHLPKNIQLWVVGQGLSIPWRRRIHRLGLSQRVKAFGHQADLRPFYQAADLFVHPTSYDACANTVLQSMASGLPGIISQRDGAHFHIKNAINGWLLPNPQDPEALQEKLHQALAAERTPLSQAARATMLPITWKNHVELWSKLLAD